MAQDSFSITIGGQELPQLYQDLIRLEVEQDEELAAMFRITVALVLQGDGGWTYLDEQAIAPWQPVVITAGTQDDSRQLISGYITHLRPTFGAGPEDCRLEIWGMDAGVLLDRDDVLKDWPNKKDSDIAEETLRKHGLEPVVTDSGVVHDEKLSTIIQRETDMQFLQRLATRNGYECFVDGNRGYFRPAALDPPTQAVLAVRFGDQTTVTRFALEVNALTPSAVAMAQVDHVTKDVLDAAAEPDQQPALGAARIGDYLGAGMPAGLVQLGQVVTTGAAEMAAICQGLNDQGEWFVTGEGELDSSQYGSILVPRSTVLIKGLGESYSGTYYVTRVTHTFAAGRYTQLFAVKRNALKVDGSENFSAESSGLLGVIA